MDLFHITYRMGGKTSLSEIFLDVRARRWSERIVVRVVIANEFPNASLPVMKFKGWKADEILNLFGISDFSCTYENLPTFTGITQKNGVVLKSVEMP